MGQNVSFVSFTESSKLFSQIPIKENTLKLPYVPLQSLNYIIFSIQIDSETDKASFRNLKAQFRFNSHMHLIEKAFSLKFQEPIKVKYQILEENSQKIIYTTIENSTPCCINIINLELETCEIIDGFQPVPIELEPFQHIFIAYIVKSFMNCKFRVTYSFANHFRGLERFVKEYLKSAKCITEDIHELSIFITAANQ